VGGRSRNTGAMIARAPWTAPADHLEGFALHEAAAGDSVA